MLNNEVKDTDHFASRSSPMVVVFCLVILGCFSIAVQAKSEFTPTKAQIAMHKKVAHDIKILRSLDVFPLDRITHGRKSYWVLGTTKYFDKDQTITVHGKTIIFCGILNIKDQLSPVQPKPYKSLRYATPIEGGVSGPFPGTFFLDELTQTSNWMVCRVIGNPYGVIDFSNSYVTWIPKRYKDEVLPAVKFARSHPVMFADNTIMNKSQTALLYPAKTLAILNKLLANKNIYLATWACRHLFGINQMNEQKFINGPFKTAQGCRKAYLAYLVTEYDWKYQGKQSSPATAFLKDIRTAQSAATIRSIALGIWFRYRKFGDRRSKLLLNAIAAKEKNFNANTEANQYIQAILHYEQVSSWLEKQEPTATTLPWDTGKGISTSK